MVAVIPLGTFRQLAFTMAVGLLIDTFLIRPVLTPAVLTLLGRAAGWPGSRIRTTAVSPTDLTRTASAAGADPLLAAAPSPSGSDRLTNGEPTAVNPADPTTPDPTVPDPTASGSSRPAGRTRRGRTATLAVSVVLGVVALLTGADWLSRVAAESLLSRQIQDATGSLTSPEVRINGGLFLPQVIARLLRRRPGRPDRRVLRAADHPHPARDPDRRPPAVP